VSRSVRRIMLVQGGVRGRALLCEWECKKKSAGTAGSARKSTTM
jgi:hypothetical protein